MTNEKASTWGTTNLFNQPEYSSDIEKLKNKDSFLFHIVYNISYRRTYVISNGSVKQTIVVK